MGDNQQTIAKKVSLSGVGLHTGKKVTMTFKPAPENFGRKFQRIDLEGAPIIDAHVDNVVNVIRGTNLAQDDVKVETVEHALAALMGLQIDNVLIELDSPEPPILDGSSKMYVDAFLKVGIKEQSAHRNYFTLDSQISYSEPDRGVELIAIPSDRLRLTVMVDYNSKVLGTQHASINNMEEFKDEIAESRTFCFLHEVEELVENDLIKGGGLDNAIVVVDRVIEDKELANLAHLFNQPEIHIQEEGILNNVELHHHNEPARHKLLDLVGDLALIGSPIKAHIIATRPGHKANVEFVKAIKSFIKINNNGSNAPKYNPNVPPVFDINKVKSILPHRYPFLMIDKVIELADDYVVCVKNVTTNEQFFEGHFPGNPVMPGVLQIEALAQAGGMFVLNSVPDPENYTTYFIKIENARFKNLVKPGDTLILRMELLNPIRRGICEMKGTAYVGNKVVTEAHLWAKISKKVDA